MIEFFEHFFRPLSIPFHPSDSRQAVPVGSLEFAFCVAPAHPLTHPGRPAASRMS